jgi:hypothetical protein
MKVVLSFIFLINLLASSFAHDGGSDQLAIAVVKNSYEPNAIDITVSPLENEYGEERSYEIWRVEALRSVDEARKAYRVKVVHTYEYKKSKKQQLSVDVNPID